MSVSQVIKYEGTNDVFVWKHPIEDFITGTQLIVHETQEAILFRNGQALDMFSSGKYTLQTENIPLLNKLINITTDRQSQFHCEVYFINKVDILDILWGTSSPIPIQDPKYNIILPVRANGQMGVMVEDSRKFLIKLVGTANKLEKENLTAYFRGLLMANIKEHISKLMIEKQISFLEIHSHLKEVSNQLKEAISSLYDQYGIKLINFYVNSITVPSDDPGYIKIRDALATAKEKELLAIGKKAEMDILGYNYQQERTFNVLDKVAQNEGTGATVMGTSLGLGMGVNIANVVSDSMSEAVKTVCQSDIHSKGEVKCKNCGANLQQGAKFCCECGNKVEIQEEVIVCPRCGEKTYKSKFCINCGNRLMTICTICNSELPVGSKFCLQCGGKVGD